MAHVGLEDFPVLKICVDNTEDDCDMEILEEGEVEDNSDDDSSGSEEPLKKTSKVGKRYENKGGAFVTGIDVTSQESREKRKERALRFASELTQSKPVDINFIALYSSLDISEDAWSLGKTNLRLEALHLRGVDNMNTDDIFAYFGNFSPASIEWINDTSCNVVWFERQSAARAMIGMTKPIKLIDSRAKQDDNLEESSRKRKGKTKVDRIKAKLNDEDEDMLDLDKPYSEPQEKNIVVQESDESLSCSSDSDVKEDHVIVYASEVTMPPGKWRFGMKHSKAKCLLIRFANKDDRKHPGAEKRSAYYIKHGNPNFGGLKGLISTSRHGSPIFFWSRRGYSG